MIQTSNFSQVRCQEHPNEKITNFCCNFNCLRPLCPQCVEVHTKSHNRQEIESWKNSINKSLRNIKTTITRLRELQSRVSGGPANRPVEAIEEEAIRKIHHLRKQLHEMIDELFLFHEKEIRTAIKNEFRTSPIDMSKLKTAIEQLQKLSMKLSNPNTSVSALKRSMLLDHQSLINHFEGELRNMPFRTVKDEFMINIDTESIARIRKELESVLNYDSQPKTKYTATQHHEEVMYRPTSLTIRADDYFKDTGSKYMHFFIPFSNQLKILTINNAEQENPNWKTVRLNLKHELPSFYKSIITPEGQIYLTGGSDKGNKLGAIYRYNEERHTLEHEAILQVPRSSHSICYMHGHIYLIGGFKEGNQACRDCQTFNVSTKVTKSIEPLCFPSANGSATGFNNKYIFKFGGVHNRVEPSNHIEMYSLKDNVWIEIDPAIEQVNDHFWLLSFSACVQINPTEIFVFGGYNDMQDESSSNLSYTLHIAETAEDISFMIKGIDAFPLPQAQGFWDNNPIVHNSRVYALQNITDSDQVSSLIDQRRLLIFNGKKWLSL